eukprot:jgi/Chlat1/72/Chrsp1S03116
MAAAVVASLGAGLRSASAAGVVEQRVARGSSSTFTLAAGVQHGRRNAAAGTRLPARCCAEQQSDSTSSSGRGFGNSSRGRSRPLNPKETVLSAIEGVHKAGGRQTNSVNLVLGDTASQDDWRQLDEKVNTYPSLRSFKAIGSGGDDFRDSMVSAVKRILEVEVDERLVTTRESAKGKYISVQVGPVTVNSGDQVIAVYEAMRADTRLRYFI